MSQVLAPIGPRPTLRRRILAMTAIGIARPLAKLSPKHIRRILRLLRRGSAPATHEQAARARETITTVSARCAGKYCLERSLAAAILCRMSGTWPQWCAGVRVTAPFASHAWLEVGGRPVGESASIAAYRTLISV